MAGQVRASGEEVEVQATSTGAVRASGEGVEFQATSTGAARASGEEVEFWGQTLAGARAAGMLVEYVYGEAVDTVLLQGEVIRRFFALQGQRLTPGPGQRP